MRARDIRSGMAVRIGRFKPGWNAMRSGHHTGAVVEVMALSSRHEGCWILWFKKSGIMDTYHPNEFEPVAAPEEASTSE